MATVDGGAGLSCAGLVRGSAAELSRRGGGAAVSGRGWRRGGVRPGVAARQAAEELGLPEPEPEPEPLPGPDPVSGPEPDRLADVSGF